MNQSTSFEEAEAEFRKDPEYVKASKAIAPYYDLAVKIIKRRSELGMSRKQLAYKAKLSQDTVSKLESGEHNVQFKTLVAIANALEMELL